MLCLIFGLLLVAGSAFGQTADSGQIARLDQFAGLDRIAGRGPITGFGHWPDSLRALVAMPDRTVRVLAPDRMPCVVPNLARLERMPVLRARNGDPMPNGFR